MQKKSRIQDICKKRYTCSSSLYKHENVFKMKTSATRVGENDWVYATDHTLQGYICDHAATHLCFVFHGIPQRTKDTVT